MPAPTSNLAFCGRGCPYRPQTRRRILCVFPRYMPSFGTFQHAYPLLPGVRGFMPPQGLLLIAAYLPTEWEVRLVDENIEPVSEADYRWADAVFISGMHVQCSFINAISETAHQHGKLIIVGGPSVSACPAYYPDVDILHMGELGDATDVLIERLDKDITRPARQERFKTVKRLPLQAFPIPAYHLVDMRRYFLANIQFSSGCPYLCEFCDIPELYGRQPRFKTPEQILAELDALIAAGAQRAIYFVDDNFIAHRKAAKELLPHLIEWQRRRSYPVELTCEATLNLAQWPELLEQMREAWFTTVFCGIETPEPEALRAMHKEQNLRQPIVDAVRKLNSYGLEVVAGIILGLDTDTPETVDHVLEFIQASQIPMLTINLLYALPSTPLYRRLKTEQRLNEDPARASNVVFNLSYDTVMAMWHRCIREAYDPPRLFQRFAHQTEATFPRRLPIQRKVTTAQVAWGLRVISRMFWKVGYRADYRRDFWAVARPLLKSGRIEEVVHIAMVSHHLISFTKDTLQGRGGACFYADPSRSAQPVGQEG